MVGGGRDPAAAAVPALAGAGAHAGVRHRLGYRAGASGTTSIPIRSLPPGDGLHWTGPYKSWEARCAECHATGYSRNYDARTRATRPQHGRDRAWGARPATGRARRMRPGRRRPTATTPARWPGLTAHGLTVDLGGFGRGGDRAVRRVPLAARGVLRRQPAARDAVPRRLLAGAAARRALRGGRADRRRRTTSTARSCRRRCTRAGCAAATATIRTRWSCAPRATRSAPSAIRRRATTGSRRCGRRSTTIRRTPFTRRARRGRRARAAICRERVYMGVDRRRDHGFRVPRPDLAAATGAPDVCTELPRRQGPGLGGGGDRGALSARARTGARASPPPSRRRGGTRRRRRTRWWRWRSGTTWRGSCARRRWTCWRRWPIRGSRSGRRRSSPIPIRWCGAAAAGLQRGAAAGGAAGAAGAGPRRPAAGGADRGGEGDARAPTWPAAPRRRWRRWRRRPAEWRAALASRADFPETHCRSAARRWRARNLEVAEAAFREAVALDPQLVDGWAMIARIRAATGDAAGARRAVADGLAVNPGQPDLEAMRRELGRSGCRRGG